MNLLLAVDDSPGNYRTKPALTVALWREGEQLGPGPGPMSDQATGPSSRSELQPQAESTVGRMNGTAQAERLRSPLAGSVHTNVVSNFRAGVARLAPQRTWSTHSWSSNEFAPVPLESCDHDGMRDVIRCVS
jgi:hypothetical protein